MKIDIQTIPHAEQLYPTVGNYYEEDGVEKIRVSDLGDWRTELCVVVHEIFEDYICKHRGIKESDISDFDIMFEQERADGKWQSNEEPGDDPRAPYIKEHQIATVVERLLASYLDLNWNDYNNKVNNL